MPSLDFPNSPALNDEFTAPGGNKWVWDGLKWMTVHIIDETIEARDRAEAAAAAAEIDAANADADAAAADADAATAAAAASAASASEIAAAASAASAATALDSFDDRYLGSKTTPPTLDNDGNALVVGALYYRSTGTVEQIGMWVWDGATWVKASAAISVSYVLYEYTATASQTTFTGADLNALTLTYTVGLVSVYLNGTLLMPGEDYTASDGTSVVLTTGATVGDSVALMAYSSFNVANTYTQAQVDALVGDGGGISLHPFLFMGG